MNSLTLEIIYDCSEDLSEPYYYIRCTDDTDTDIEIYGSDVVYNTEDEAREGLNAILNRLKKGV